jgi:membrane protease YdiL (CAAX protease family)
MNEPRSGKVLFSKFAGGGVMRATEPLQRAFYGPSGVRAVWRAFAFFIVLFIVVEGLLGYVLKMEHDIFGAGGTPGGVLLEKAFLFACTLVVTIIAGHFEHKSLADYGFPLRKAFGKDFWAGSVLGFGIITANIALMVSLHAFSFGAIAMSGMSILKYGLLWAIAYLSVGIAEEFAFRGYLQYALTRSFSFWPAAVVTSIIFGLVHLDVHAPWPTIANFCVLALIACMALRRTGSLWFAIGCHMGFDWGDAFVYSTGQGQVNAHLFHAAVHGSKWISGGNAGPDGNIFNVFLVAAAILLLSRVYPEVKYPGDFIRPSKSG